MLFASTKQGKHDTTAAAGKEVTAFAYEVMLYISPALPSSSA